MYNQFPGRRPLGRALSWFKDAGLTVGGVIKKLIKGSNDQTGNLLGVLESLIETLNQRYGLKRWVGEAMAGNEH